MIYLCVMCIAIRIGLVCQLVLVVADAGQLSIELQMFCVDTLHYISIQKTLTLVFRQRYTCLLGFCFHHEIIDG